MLRLLLNTLVIKCLYDKINFWAQIGFGLTDFQTNVGRTQSDMHSDTKRMALIGAAGGAAGKGTKLRREVARKAAAARWANKHRITGHGPIIRVVSEGSTLNISGFPKALLDQLRNYRPVQEAGRLGWSWEDAYTIETDGSLSTSLGFFSRIEQALIRMGSSIEYVRLPPAHPKPIFNRSAFRGLTKTQKEYLRQMLHHPGGACVFANQIGASALAGALVRAFPKHRGIVVAPTD